MKTAYTIMMLVILTTSGLWAAQPYGRACLTVVDQQATSKNPQGSEQVFGAGLQPADGRQLKLYLDANSSCLALIAVFEWNGERPVNNWRPHNWRPRLVEVEPWEEKTLPPPAEKWDWTKGPSEFDFFVIFLEKESAQAGDLKKLVEAMKDSKEGSVCWPGLCVLPGNSPGVKPLRKLSSEKIGWASLSLVVGLPEKIDI